MLDKIKTLEEIITPIANKRGISFEDYLEFISEDERFEIFESQFKELFSWTPYNFHYQLTERLFKYSKTAAYLSTAFQIDLSDEDYKDILSKYIKIVYSNDLTHMDPLIINSKIYSINWLTKKERKSRLEDAKERNRPTNPFDGVKYLLDHFERETLAHDCLCKIIEELYIDLTSSDYNIFILNGDAEIKEYLNNLNSFKEQLPELTKRASLTTTSWIEKSIQILLDNRHMMDQTHRVPSTFLPNSLDNMIEKFNIILEEITNINKYQRIWEETSHAACSTRTGAYAPIRELNFRGTNFETKERIEKHDKMIKDYACVIFIERVNTIQKLLQNVDIKKLIKYSDSQIKATMYDLTKIYNKKGVKSQYYRLKSQEANMLKLKETIYNFKNILQVPI